MLENRFVHTAKHALTIRWSLVQILAGPPFLWNELGSANLPGYGIVKLILRLVGLGGGFIPLFLIFFCQRAGIIPGTGLPRVPHYYRPIGSLNLVDDAIGYA